MTRKSCDTVVGGRGLRRRQRYRFGFDQEGIGQAADLGRHGGREEQGLADLRQQRDDALDIGNEAHIEHAVGFVDHQDLDVVQQDAAAIEQIHQAAGRGDQHVDAAVEQPSPDRRSDSPPISRPWSGL